MRARCELPPRASPAGEEWEVHDAQVSSRSASSGSSSQCRHRRATHDDHLVVNLLCRRGVAEADEAQEAVSVLERELGRAGRAQKRDEVVQGQLARQAAAACVQRERGEW